jgi:hypothetical protein
MRRWPLSVAALLLVVAVHLAFLLIETIEELP